MNRCSAPTGAATIEFRYKAFISYSWADKAWGAWLHRALETYRPPKGMDAAARPLYPIFKDREEEAAGASIGASIEAALGASEFLIVLCSPRAAASPWVNHEIAWFKTHRDPNKILALVVGGEPGSSQGPVDAADACFPATLLYRVDADLAVTEARDDTPLAADARDRGDGKRLAKLKLAAAMLGVGLDALVQRDDRRRTARRRLLLSALMALSTILAGLSIFAFTQRDAAVLARNQAVALKKEVEFQRDQAQSLVEFMVTDLRKRLDAVGRLDVLEAVGTRLADFYAEQSLATLDPDALGRRARVQLLLGEVDNSLGNLDHALARYRAAAATTRELLRRDPDNQQRIFDHAQSVFWVGQIAWQRGDAATARLFWTQYYQQAQHLVVLDPDKDDWQAEVDYANSNLGTLEMDQGNAAEAEQYFRNSLAVSSRLLTKNAKDVDRVIAAGQSYSWLANALVQQAKIDEARWARHAELAIYDRATQGSPERADIKRLESIAGYDLADILLAAGQIGEALAEATVAVHLAEQMLGNDPENLELADRASLAHSILGEAYGHAGQPGAARKQLLAASAIASRLTVKDDSIVRWRGKVGALPALILARLEERTRHPTTALTIYHRLASTLRPMLATSANERAIKMIYCAALAGQARLTPQNSHANWQQIVSLLAPEAERLGPKTLTVLAEALVNSDRTDSAKPIVTKLYQAGYRHPDFMALLQAHPALQPQGAGKALR